jgi:hypothetical protein
LSSALKAFAILRLLWSTDCPEDNVTAIDRFDEFLENDAARLTCGPVENDFQLCSLCGTAGCKDKFLSSSFRKVKDKSELPIWLRIGSPSSHPHGSA